MMDAVTTIAIAAISSVATIFGTRVQITLRKLDTERSTKEKHLQVKLEVIDERIRNLQFLQTTCNDVRKLFLSSPRSRETLGAINQLQSSALAYVDEACAYHMEDILSWYGANWESAPPQELIEWDWAFDAVSVHIAEDIKGNLRLKEMLAQEMIEVKQALPFLQLWRKDVIQKGNRKAIELL